MSRYVPSNMSLLVQHNQGRELIKAGSLIPALHTQQYRVLLSFHGITIEHLQLIYCNAKTRPRHLIGCSRYPITLCQTPLVGCRAANALNISALKLILAKPRLT
jgi:hypothetical protein